MSCRLAMNATATVAAFPGVVSGAHPHRARPRERRVTIKKTTPPRRSFVPLPSVVERFAISRRPAILGHSLNTSLGGAGRGR